LDELDKQVSLDILNVAASQAFFSFSETDSLMLGEYAMVLLLVVLRRVNNAKGESEISRIFVQARGEDLVKTLFAIPMQAEYDEEAAKYFLLIEEILLSLGKIGYFLQNEIGLQFIERFINEVLAKLITSDEDEDEEDERTITGNPTVTSYILGSLRLLILM
jgi:hypothetical protein